MPERKNKVKKNQPGLRSSVDSTSPLPKIVTRDQVAYLAGTSVPIARLERARRLGSTEADLRSAFPDLPPRALEAVEDYIRRNPAKVKEWADELSPASVTSDEQDDDGVGFDEELESLLETEAELFRRLAR